MKKLILLVLAIATFSCSENRTDKANTVSEKKETVPKDVKIKTQPRSNINV